MEYKSTDYYLLFQTSGVNFFFTDLCTKYYDKFNGVTISVNNEWRYYVHLQEKINSENLYKKFYESVEVVKKGAEVFTKAKDEALTAKDELQKAEEVTPEMFDKFVSLSATIMDEYSKYDHMYTDYLFKDDREIVPDLINLVQENKNTFRDYANQIFFNEDSYLVLLINKISKQYDVPTNELFYSPIDSVRKLVSDGSFSTNGKDGDDYVVVRDNGQFEYLIGDSAKSFIKNFIIEEDFSLATEVKGISVSKKGVFKGVVKKISVDYSSLQQSVSSLDKIEAGFVLVTESTTPELLGLMSRSIGIITDMGGMLSHAAITSRELGIPCIIGTKVATQVLKDGDMVEVDADNGVVRIIK